MFEWLKRVEKVCRNCSNYSPDSLDTDTPEHAYCWGTNPEDDDESEKVIMAYFEAGTEGCPWFDLRSELRFRERLFPSYFAWKEARFYNKWDKQYRGEVDKDDTKR